MEKVKRLSKKHHTDSEVGCSYRYISSKTERQILHDHDFFEMFLIVKGSVYHLISEDKIKLSKGTLCLIRPADKHMFSKVSGEFEMINVTITSDTVNSLLAYLNFPLDILINPKYPPMIELSESKCEKMADIFKSFDCLDIENKPLKQRMIRAKLADIFATYFCNDESYSNIPLWLLKTLEKMQKKENFVLGGKRMIELSGKTYEHLSRTLKRYYNITVSEYVNSLRLNFAANMLKNSRESISAICYEAGFENISWFYTCFAKKYGITPKQFRNNY